MATQLSIQRLVLSVVEQLADYPVPQLALG
jgi:hypothetical protein